MRTARSCPLLFTLVLSITLSGTAPAQESRNVTLLSHLKLHSSYTNHWAYIHPDGREYVALGTRDGISIVRLTDPANPAEVGFIPSIGCTTRDVDQYQTYLYAIGGVNCGTTADPGLQIISMADPDNPVLLREVHGLVETAENITIDAARGLLYAAEVDVRQGARGMRIISLADPLNPVVVFANDAYEVHDITAVGSLAYLSDIITPAVHVLDTTSPASPLEISVFTTNGPTHSAWPSDDGRYLYVTNENIDGGELIAYDALNIVQPVETWRSVLVPQSTAHYPRVLGNKVYVAHYSAGVRVVDISRRDWPVEVGYLDTFSGDNQLIAGIYDTCPFYPSGIATATDRSEGLYVLRAESNYGLVRGTVLDGANGRVPLAGATVRALADGPSTTTGPDGRYGLAPAPGAAVTIEVSKLGYLTQTATLALALGSDQTEDFLTSKSPTGTIKGTVVRSSDQAPLGDAEVSAAGTPFLDVTSNRGTYSLTKVPEGTYSIRADRPGYVPSVVPVPVIAKKTATANFALANALFYDEVETDRGWTLGAPDDNATAGLWVRAVPVGVYDAMGDRQIQPDEDHTPGSGTMCFVTGNGVVGGDMFSADVDGGKTTLISPVLPLGSVSDPRIAFWRWYFLNSRGVAPSPLVTELSNDGGATWVVADSLQVSRTWERFELRVTDFFPVPGNVRVRIIAQDRLTTNGSVVEAAIDDFEYYSGSASSSGSVTQAAGADPSSSALQMRALGRPQGGADLDLSLVGEPARATVRIFDVRGRLLRTVHDGPLAAGRRRLSWDGRSDGGEKAAAGVYLAQVRAGELRAQAKVVLFR